MLASRTRQMKIEGIKALVPFFTAGYPDLETFEALAYAASKAGCPVIEVGIPFSDPIADGPVIQASSQHALDQGVTLGKILEVTDKISKNIDAEIVFMGYLNPLLRMGAGAFAAAARKAGVSGIIVPDLPLEESAKMRSTLANEGICLVDLIARTSSPERIARIAAKADGFIYLVALTGVTGATPAAADDLKAFAERVRPHTPLPLYVGFGIATKDQAARAADHTDGVIIGSALIRLLQASRSRSEGVEKVKRFLAEAQEAVNNTRSR